MSRPKVVRRLRRAAAVPLRRATSGLRLLPDFLVVGANRSGTTSLYTYLCRHPQIARARRKEVHYFDLNHSRGEGWYRSMFPLRSERESAERAGGRLLTGEATPYYLFHPLAPARAHALVPDAGLVAILRNPVDRAFSHWLHTRRKGQEPLPFEEAVDREPERTAGEAARMTADPGYFSPAHQRYSYLARGEYLWQLEAWAARFGRERLLVLISEPFFEDPRAACDRVAEFLGLPPADLGPYARLNAAPGGDRMPAATRARLAERFRPHNERLAGWLGFDPGWDG